MTIDNFDIPFNFVRFISFMKDNNIVATCIAAVLSDRVNEVTGSFVTDIVLPIINRDGDNDGESDIKKIENKKIKVYGCELCIGKFVTSIVKFIIVAYLMFVLSKIFK